MQRTLSIPGENGRPGYCVDVKAFELLQELVTHPCPASEFFMRILLNMENTTPFDPKEIYPLALFKDLTSHTAERGINRLAQCCLTLSNGNEKFKALWEKFGPRESSELSAKKASAITRRGFLFGRATKTGSGEDEVETSYPAESLESRAREGAKVARRELLANAGLTAGFAVAGAGTAIAASQAEQPLLYTPAALLGLIAGGIHISDKNHRAINELLVRTNEIIALQKGKEYEQTREAQLGIC